MQTQLWATSKKGTSGVCDAARKDEEVGEYRQPAVKVSGGRLRMNRQKKARGHRVSMEIFAESLSVRELKKEESEERKPPGLLIDSPAGSENCEE